MDGLELLCDKQKSISINLTWCLLEMKWAGCDNVVVLSPSQKVARQIRRVRLERGLSQRQLSDRAGFRQPYLCQVERGVRAISVKAAQRLEFALQLKPGKFCKGLLSKESRRLWRTTRLALREFGRCLRDFVEGGRPAIPQPHQHFGLDNPLWPMGVHLGEEAAREVEQLELLRTNQPRFWRDFNSFRFDSWSEKRLLVRVALLGMQLVGVRLDQLGCGLEVVNGKTGGKPGLHRAFVYKGENASLVWCPQVAVRAGQSVFCVDNLLLVRARGKTFTVIVEVDGAPFHQDRARQIRRDRLLGVPVLHLDAGRLGEPRLIERILSWALRLAEAA